jgi:hypothetical protein
VVLTSGTLLRCDDVRIALLRLKENKKSIERGGGAQRIDVPIFAFFFLASVLLLSGGRFSSVLLQNTSLYLSIWFATSFPEIKKTRGWW